MLGQGNDNKNSENSKFFNYLDNDEDNIDQ